MILGRTVRVSIRQRMPEGWMPNIMSAKALQRVFPTTVASYLTFHGSVRQEATGNRQD